MFDYLPLIAFFVIYKFVDIYWATGALMGFYLLHIGYLKFKGDTITTKHYVMLGLAVLLGGLTLLLRDDAYIKLKATLVYTGFSVTLLISLWAFKKNLMASLLGGILSSAFEGQKIDVPERTWRTVNYVWAVLLLMVAVANYVVARYFPTDVWVNFKVFGLTGITFVALIATLASLYKYLPQE